MIEDLSPIQRVLLDTFKAFSLFCKENDIQYFAAYGTLLGAVRHKGFIPWDDDIDVFMVRDQYDKFLSLREEMKQTKYMVADYHDEGYPYTFAKYYDTTKTFWEYPQFPFIIGPFVDIFPLETYDIESEACSKLYDQQHYDFWKYRKSISYQSWSEICKDFITLNGFEGPIKLVKQLVYKPQKNLLRKKVEIDEQRIREQRGDYYKEYSEIKSLVFQKKWYEKAIEIPFEDTSIMVPAAYHEILTASYGDYMTPPPSHQRTGHHTAYYMNLTDRLSVEQIRKLKSNNFVSKRNMGFKTLLNELIHRRGF